MELTLAKRVNEAADKAAKIALQEIVDSRGFKVDVSNKQELATLSSVFLDLCGFAYITVDTRRKNKDSVDILKINDLLTNTGTVDLSYDFRSRQEFGVRVAACKAAIEVLEDAGITGLSLYSRLD